MSHLLELTQVWRGKQQRGSKYGMQLSVTPKVKQMSVRAYLPLSQVEIKGYCQWEVAYRRINFQSHAVLPSGGKGTDPQQRLLSSVSKNLTHQIYQAHFKSLDHKYCLR